MEIIEKEVIKEPKKEYASKGLAGTALGFGIGGAALALLNSRGRFGLFGNNMPENVNINTLGTRGSNGPTAFEAWEKGCEDVLGMQKDFYNWALAQQSQRFNDRSTINNEMFGLYKSQVDADFGLYKSNRDANDEIIAKHNADSFALYKNQRDNFDVLSERISNLETKQAVADAVEPWRSKVLDMQINNVAQASCAGIALEAERRCCADNKIVNYLNSNFYPISVMNLAAGTTSTPRITSNPLCGCCGDGYSYNMNKR